VWQPCSLHLKQSTDTQARTPVTEWITAVLKANTTLLTETKVAPSPVHKAARLTLLMAEGGDTYPGIKFILILTNAG